MVAPYTALQSFRYKVKLTPGSQKKGKAVKQAVDVLSRVPPPAISGGAGDGYGQTSRGGAAADKEREKAFDVSLRALMKAATGGGGGGGGGAGAGGDLAHVMCGSGVKVSMPAGAAKAINASRKKGGGK